MLDIVTINLMIQAVLKLFPQIPAGVSTFLTSVGEQLPSLQRVGVDLLDYWDMQLSKVKTMIAENRDPTDAEWSALSASLDDEMNKLNAQATPK